MIQHLSQALLETLVALEHRMHRLSEDRRGAGFVEYLILILVVIGLGIAFQRMLEDPNGGMALIWKEITTRIASSFK